MKKVACLNYIPSVLFFLNGFGLISHPLLQNKSTRRLFRFQLQNKSTHPLSTEKQDVIPQFFSSMQIIRLITLSPSYV